jgi:hypothetical protein
MFMETFKLNDTLLKASLSATEDRTNMASLLFIYHIMYKGMFNHLATRITSSDF